MIPALSILDAISTKPGDLVDVLYAKSHHAFVAETQSDFAWSLSKRLRDRGSLSNYARAKWDLIVPSSGGYAKGMTVPIKTLFAARISSPPRTVVKTQIYPWDRRGGRLATVADVLNAGSIPLTRCHWAYQRRRVLVRFLPTELESGLPDLARAIGGRFDLKTKTIEFDPHTFRDQTVASISENVLKSDRRSTLEWALVRTGIRSATAFQLTDLFSAPDRGISILLDAISDEERASVRRYLSAALRVIRGTSTEQEDYFDKIVDFEKTPALAITSSGVGRLSYLGRDGKTRVEL